MSCSIPPAQTHETYAYTDGQEYAHACASSPFSCHTTAQVGCTRRVSAWSSTVCAVQAPETHQLPDRDFIQRRDALGKLFILGTTLTPAVLRPFPADAKVGEYAKMELDGRGGGSVSSLGQNDIPGAGKIDPYDNREKANAEYAARMSNENLISEKREQV